MTKTIGMECFDGDLRFIDLFFFLFLLALWNQLNERYTECTGSYAAGARIRSIATTLAQWERDGERKKNYNPIEYSTCNILWFHEEHEKWTKKNTHTQLKP